MDGNVESAARGESFELAETVREVCRRLLKLEIFAELTVFDPDAPAPIEPVRKRGKAK